MDLIDEIMQDWREHTDRILGLMRRNIEKPQESRLPDEIDLYNFFEEWHGRAWCTANVYAGMENSFGVYNIHQLEKVKHRCEKIEYVLCGNRYHAIKFKNRGTFLVSERRYRELKTGKG